MEKIRDSCCIVEDNSTNDDANKRAAVALETERIDDGTSKRRKRSDVRIKLRSLGARHGVDESCDFYYSLVGRAKNPHWVEKYDEKTGLDPDIVEAICGTSQWRARCV